MEEINSVDHSMLFLHLSRRCSDNNLYIFKKTLWHQPFHSPDDTFQGEKDIKLFWYDRKQLEYNTLGSPLFMSLNLIEFLFVT